MAEEDAVYQRSQPFQGQVGLVFITGAVVTPLVNQSGRGRYAFAEGNH